MTASPTATTTYTVTGTDTNDCQNVASQTVTVQPKISCPIDVTGVTAAGQCGAVVTFPLPTDDCSNATVVCTPPSGSTFPQGTTPIRCRATDAASNTAWCSFNVIIPQPPICAITASPGLTICQGGTVILTAPNGKKRYVWHGPEQDGATVQTIIVGTPGVYTSTQENWYGPTNCCSVTVAGSPLPNCIISGGPNVSPTSPATLCGAFGMASYVWLGGPQFAGSTNQCITVTVAGTYTLQIINSNGCVARCSTTLEDTTAQPCFINGNLSICQGSTTMLTAPNGMSSYAWTGPYGFTASQQFIIVGVPGQYGVTQVDGRGHTNTCSVLLVVNAPPPCSITGPKWFCQGGSTTLCGPAGLRSQYWLGPQNNGLNTPCNKITIPGSYTLVMTDSNGCERACTVQVSTKNCIAF